MSTYTIKKYICVCLAFLVMISAVMTTMAWRDYSQHKSNEFYGITLTETQKGRAALEKKDKETGAVLSGFEFELYKTNASGNDVQIGDTFTTDENGMIFALRLDAGDYYWLETKPAYGWTYDKDDSGEEIRKYPFTIEEDSEGKISQTLVMAAAKNQRQYADLKITKTVVDLSETEAASIQADVIETEIEELADTEVFSGAPEATSDETGEQIVTPNEQAETAINTETITALKADPEMKFEFTITFTGIADGPIKVALDDVETDMNIANGKLVIELKHGQAAIIKNLPVGTGYSVEEKPAQGYITIGDGKQGVIPPEGAIVTFTNYYCGDKQTKLLVRKTVSGTGADLGKEFDFIVTIGGVETKFKLRHGETKIIDLPQGATWSVREDDYKSQGYETSVVTRVYIEDGVTIVEVTYTNNFVGPPLTKIEGEKTWDLAGKNIPLPASITVNLKDGNTVVQTLVVRPDAGGKWLYSFTVPRYRADGITEIVYTIEEIRIPGFTSTVNGFNIRNTYTPETTVTVPPVKKNIAGSPVENVKFSFKLIAQGNAPMPDGSASGEKTISVTGAGEANFGQIRYTQAGTYRYTIVEILESRTGWVYDPMIYTLTVTVTEQGGQLTTARTLVKQDGTSAGEKAEFTNKYEKGKEPDKPKVPGKPDRPVTGDDNNIWLWALILIGSAVALRFFMLYQIPEKSRQH